MNRVGLRQIGSIDLLDLNVISEFYGRDFLPYPFMRTKPSPYPTKDGFDAYARSVPDRFNNGDLRAFRRWAAAYAYADIRVECHVQYVASDTPSGRVMAHRRGELGFFATQRTDDDVVDVYSLSPYDLGTAVAESVELTRPGNHARILIKGLGPAAVGHDDVETTLVRHREERDTPTVLARSDIAVWATVQTHWRPTRRWGVDRARNAVVWVRMKDDGEYVYEPDFTHAKPMTGPNLAARIDRLIADDVAVLREFRNGL